MTGYALRSEASVRGSGSQRDLSGEGVGGAVPNCRLWDTKAEASPSE